MKKIMLTTVILFLAAAVCAQGNDAKFTDSMKQEMCSKVKEAASHAWKGYKDHAWGADDLKPLTKQPKNWYKTSMLMTPVDAFDTFTLMGLTAEAKEAKDLILGKLDFNIDNDVQVFEITIRLLGGLITAYELDGNKKFLALAHDLGNRLMPAFHTPTGMPYRYVHLQPGKTRDGIN
ncbi:MAG TPA: glycoside hydrolase family 47 protein, partial [Ferruginibacter sp.]|nr:glycoside hydrolase family 47 protein [Ferruginibacter sp.]